MQTHMQLFFARKAICGSPGLIMDIFQIRCPKLSQFNRLVSVSILLKLVVIIHMVKDLLGLIQSSKVMREWVVS